MSDSKIHAASLLGNASRPEMSTIGPMICQISVSARVVRPNRGQPFTALNPWMREGAPTKEVKKDSKLTLTGDFQKDLTALQEKYAVEFKPLTGIAEIEQRDSWRHGFRNGPFFQRIASIVKDDGLAEDAQERDQARNAAQAGQSTGNVDVQSL
jgi:hypothetical protein